MTKKSQRAINGGNDAYFTKPDVAKECVSILKEFLGKRKIYINQSPVIEPSAGDGSFLKFLPPETIAYDIEPKAEGIIEADFFTTQLSPFSIVVGNPPFGFASSLAIKFFNHAAKNNAKVIAFIVPKTFKKISTHEKLNTYYHLKYSMDLPKNSFLVDGNEYDVPCVFQIWVRFNYERKKLIDIPDYIQFVEKDQADFAIRRVGGKSGKILDGFDHTLTSTYFVKSDIPDIKEILQAIDFSDIVNNTAGVKSLSKKEILLAIHQYITKGEVYDTAVEDDDRQENVLEWAD